MDYKDGPLIRAGTSRNIFGGNPKVILFPTDIVDNVPEARDRKD